MVENKIFKKLDFAVSQLVDTEFEACTFIDCLFGEHSISNITFRECEFSGCNFGNALLKNTVFNEIQFTNCKMLGLDFSVCDTMLLTVNFSECNLSFGSFYQLRIRGTKFKGCMLESVDFTETDLTAAVFDNSNLREATFENTILNQANLKTAKNFKIDPQINKLKKARFSHEGIKGLLTKYDISIE